MIQKLLFSNDKSTVQLLPRNYKKWFKDIDFQANELSFMKFLYNFSDFMKNHADRVIKLTHKYKAEFYFKFFVVTQSVRKPFTIYIAFNYIEYLNKSGFNYIIKSSDYNDLKPFIQDIIENYIEYLEDFCKILKDKYEDNNNLNDRKLVSLMEKVLITEYKKSREVALVQLSVTCDIHFKDNYNKSLFFDVIKNLRKEHYKVMIVEDETVFFYPFNKNLQIIDKNIPKIRFYDKQKDTIYRYYKKKKQDKHFFLLKEFDDVTFTERFEAVDILSQESKKLEGDFIKALTSLNDTIRFELEFNKKAVKVKFKKTDFFKLNLDNEQIIFDYLKDIMDMKTTSFKDTVFHDLVTGFKEVATFNKSKINVFEVSGDITDRFNFIIKEAGFLNRITFFTPLKNGLSSLSDPYTGMSQNAISSKIKRLRHQGIVKGFGKGVILNQPYRSLLEVYNYYHVYNCITRRKFTPRSKAKLSRGVARRS